MSVRDQRQAISATTYRVTMDNRKELLNGNRRKQTLKPMKSPRRQGPMRNSRGMIW